MRRKAFSMVVAVIFAAALFSSGCSSVGYVVGGAPTTFQGDYEIEIANPRTDILNVIAEVGKAMGYSVSALNVKGNSISISSRSSVVAGAMIGTINNITITATIMDSGKKIYVITTLVGNFGVGTKEESDKIFNDFKSKLLEKIRQKQS